MHHPPSLVLADAQHRRQPTHLMQRWVPVYVHAQSAAAACCPCCCPAAAPRHSGTWLLAAKVAMIGSGAWACAALHLVAQNCVAADVADEFVDDVRMWVYEEEVEVRLGAHCTACC